MGGLMTRGRGPTVWVIGSNQWGQMSRRNQLLATNRTDSRQMNKRMYGQTDKLHVGYYMQDTDIQTHQQRTAVDRHKDKQTNMRQSGRQKGHKKLEVFRWLG